MVKRNSIAYAAQRNGLAKEFLLAILSRVYANPDMRPTHNAAVEGAFKYADKFLKKANEKSS